MPKRQPFDLPDEQPPFIYDLPPPNDGAHDIYGLMFGREGYEEIRHLPASHDEHNPYAKFWDQEAGKLARHLKWNWRELLDRPDTWALIYIWQDAERKFLLNKREIYLRLELFDPELLEAMLIKHPKVVAMVHEIAKKNYASHAFKPLVSFLLRFFRTDFRHASEEADRQRYIQYPLHREYEARVYIPFTFEEKYQQALKQLDKAVELIAKFLARHYGLYTDQWVPLLAEHADLSNYWQHFTSKALSEPKPVRKPLQVIKKIRDESLYT